jgi:hypothetical protein
MLCSEFTALNSPGINNANIDRWKFFRFIQNTVFFTTFTDSEEALHNTGSFC